MKYIQLWIALSFILCIKLANAQTCSSCSVNITTTSNGSYTINAGETFCVDTAGKFTGTLLLDGGTICNKGIFKPSAFTFISGSINNYSSVSFNAGLTLNSACSLYCEKKTFLRINGTLTVSGGSFTGKGICNIHDNVSFTSGTVNNSGIINCRLLSGLITSITNTGIINKD